VQILSLAAKRGNSVVEETLSILLDRRDPLNAETIANLTGPICSAAVATVESNSIADPPSKSCSSVNASAGRREITNRKKLVLGHLTRPWLACQLRTNE
jgi:hypothetical protein